MLSKLQKMCAVSRFGREEAIEPRQSTEVSGCPIIKVSELIAHSEIAEDLLTRACISVFNGYQTARSLARDLDYFAYGDQISNRAASIANEMVALVGDKVPGDVIDETATDE